MARQTVAGLVADLGGRAAVAKKLRVVPTAVSHAISREIIPAGWYLILKSLADAEGVDCPTSLFAFRPIRKPSVRK